MIIAGDAEGWGKEEICEHLQTIDSKSLLTDISASDGDFCKPCTKGLG